MEIGRQSSTKCHKDSDREQNMRSVDRLNSLPDDVICHILSFLPPKLSVTTSILARRWRFLWAHVPNLCFDSENHHSRMRFLSIINKVMLLHKMQSITTFSFYYQDWNQSREYKLETWITIAIERNAQNIYLDLDLVDRLPRCLFTCRTVVDLRLHNCIGIPSSGAIYLPSLKKLDLFTLEYEVDEDLPRLLSGCPVLEELIVRWIVERDWGCCIISSSTVKRLTIEFPVDNFEFYNPYNTVKINAPALLYLVVYNCSYDHISLSPMPSLIEAVICFDNYYVLEVDYYFYTRCILRFIDSLCNVKCLKLSGSFEEFLDLGVAGPYVRFDTLTRLELAVDWRFIPKFLDSADNLEVLVIYKVDEKLQKWIEPVEKRRACLLFSLRTVTIVQFGCTEQELNMVRYLLRNAHVLKKMEIYCQHDGVSSKTKFDALHRISLFHRGSRECEVAFSFRLFGGWCSIEDLGNVWLPSL